MQSSLFILLLLRIGPYQKAHPWRSLWERQGPAACQDERRCSVRHYRNDRRRGNHTESHRRERPMCRSARERTELFPIKTKNVPLLCHSDRSDKRSGGIHHVAEKYQHKVKSATWEDSSTPFHYARNDIIGRWFRFSTQVIFATCGTAHRPFPTYFNGRIQMNNVCCPNNCQLSTVNFPAVPAPLFYDHPAKRGVVFLLWLW